MDVERDRAMQEDAIFRMASSSKPVLGVAAMMMMEEGSNTTECHGVSYDSHKLL